MDSKFRIIFAASLFMLLGIEHAYAFFVPSAIQLLGASLSNIFAYILILASVFFVSFFGFIKAKILRKKVIFGAMASLLIIVALVGIGSEYFSLRAHNVPGISRMSVDTYATALSRSTDSYHEVNVSFSFYERSSHEEPSQVIDFNHSGLPVPGGISEVAPLLDSLFKAMRESEKICVHGSINSEEIEECMDDCRKIGGAWNCFDIYVLDILIEATDSDFAETDLNKMSMDEISEFTIISHVPQERVGRFTRIEIDDSLSAFTLRDSNALDGRLAPYYADDNILFLCYGGHSSRVLATLARAQGYNATFGSFHSITSSHIIDIEGLEEVNLEDSIIRDSYRNVPSRGRRLYLMVDGTADGMRHDDSINLTVGVFEDGELVFPGVTDEDIVDSHIICGTSIGCLTIQYWISERGLASEVDRIYFYS